jgi:hypothetical protein
LFFSRLQVAVGPDPEEQREGAPGQLPHRGDAVHQERVPTGGGRPQPPHPRHHRHPHRHHRHQGWAPAVLRIRDVKPGSDFFPIPDPTFSIPDRYRFRIKKFKCFKQCCGSMPFWGGSGSGSADPCLLMDPDPAIFVFDFQDANEKLFFVIKVFLLITFCTYIYIIFKDKKSKEVTKQQCCGRIPDPTFFPIPDPTIPVGPHQRI